MINLKWKIFIIIYIHWIIKSTETHNKITGETIKNKLGDTNSLNLGSRQSDHLHTIQKNLDLFQNKTLIVCVVVREPFVIFNPPKYIKANDTKTNISKLKNDLSSFSGIAIEVTKRLSEIFRFNVNVTIPRDGQFGIQSSTGRWTGLLGLVLRNQCDLAVTALSITAKRADYVDFTRAYYVETVGILLRTPDEAQNFLVVLEPFSPTVWFFLLVIVVFLIIVVAIMTKLEDNQHLKHCLIRERKLSELSRRRAIRALSSASSIAMAKVNTFLASQASGDISMVNVGTPNILSSQSEIIRDPIAHGQGAETKQVNTLNGSSEFGSTWTERFYYSIGCVLNILMNKDIKHPPRQTPIRILVCVWWLASIIIGNFYLGTLFEQLVLTRRPRVIETLEELVSQENIKWCVTRGSALEELFLSSDPKSIYGQLGKSMMNVTSADDGVKKVIDNNWAFIRERSILTFKLAQEHRRLGTCKMQLAREEFFSVGFGLAVPKGSPLLEPINAALTLMSENGFVARWQNDYWPQKSRFTECQSKSDSAAEAKPLSLKHFLSIYLLCTIFIGVAILVLIYQHSRSKSARS